MGYDIYITKRRNWFDTGPPEISLSEWNRVASQFADLELVDSEGDQMLQMRRGDGCKYFCFLDGQIFVKKPTLLALLRMSQLAKLLEAKVMGEEGETYDEFGTPDKTTSFVPDNDW